MTLLLWILTIYPTMMAMLRELPGLAITLPRYLIAEDMARKVQRNEPILAELTGFIAADILDGVVLRQFDLDTKTRRIADGVIDQVSVTRVLHEVGKKNETARPYIGILAARAALVGAVNSTHLALTSEVSRGKNKQRAAHIATALFGLAAYSGNKKLTHATGIIATGISIATALPYFSGVGRKHEKDFRYV